MNPHAPSRPGEFVFLRKPGQFAPCAIRFALPADADINAVVETFTDYLRACGFHVPSGHILDFVPEGEYGDPKLRDTIETDGTSAEEFG